MPPESAIRDWLAVNLDFLESGLQLIKKEQYLPNDQGAAGFIDIFAKDSEDRIVVVEIKRAESAAREAITELAKYAALLRITRKLRKSEIRFIVVSTAWDQLRAPFSEWADSTDYNILGFRVTANNDGSLSNKVAIQPIQLDTGRTICRRQFVQYYRDDSACDAAEPLFSQMSNVCGIQDYLIFRVRVTEENVYGVTRGLIYAQQKHAKEFYVTGLQKRLGKEEFAELMSYTEDLDPDDAVDELADHLPCFNEIPSETAEICYPEKVVDRLSRGIWEKLSVKRWGSFSLDERLTDETLWFELGGLGGTSFEHFVAFIRSGDRAKITEVNEALETTLFNNPVWRHAIADLLRYVSALPKLSMMLMVFDNSSILDSIYVLGKHQKPSGFPMFSLFLDEEKSAREFIGTVRWNGKHAPSLQTLLRDNFQGDFFDGYLMARHFGGQKPVNAALMRELGLEFCTDSHQYVPPPETSLYDIRVQGSRIVGDEKPRNNWIREFAMQEAQFIHELVATFDAHIWQGADKGTDEDGNVERHLDEIADFDRGLQGGQFFIGAPDKCDLCGRSLSQEKYMIDGGVRPSGIGACMCARCFDRRGQRLGWGYGQLYLRIEDKWLLVAGFPPEETQEA
jgi:hypothetical protein